MAGYPRSSETGTIEDASHSVRGTGQIGSRRLSEMRSKGPRNKSLLSVPDVAIRLGISS